jgi:hypothetical protein
MVGDHPQGGRQRRVKISLSGKASPRHARPCAGHPRLSFLPSKTWMAGTSPAMTNLGIRASRPTLGQRGYDDRNSLPYQSALSLQT